MFAVQILSKFTIEKMRKSDLYNSRRRVTMNRRKNTAKICSMACEFNVRDGW